MRVRGLVATGGLLLLALVALACGRAGLRLPWSESTWSPPPTTALLEVELLRGFAGPLPEAAEALEVEVLLDVSNSMAKSAGAGASRSQATRQAAARLVRGLPAATPIRLSALGIQARDCQPATPVAQRKAGEARDELLSWIEALEPAGEGSLAGALELLALAATRRHVVAFTDLGGECGGDLCAAATALSASGSRLDLVVVGDAATPACLADVAIDDDRDARPGAAVEPLAFVVRRPGPNGWTPVARGLTDGSRLELPAGLSMLRVELESPMYIGPLSFEAATLTRIRVLDFPGLEEPVREWHSDTRSIDPLQEAS